MNDSERGRIVFFGNSITAAYGIDPYEGFPYRIRARLREEGLAYRVVNAGISGETTGGGRERLSYVLRDTVDVFVLELGINDALQGIPADSARKHLAAIIEGVRDAYPQSSIVLLGARPPAPPAIREAFSEMYRQLAEQYRIPLLPNLLEGVLHNSDYVLPDGLHPNAAGHRQMAERVWEVLRPVLKSR